MPGRSDAACRYAYSWVNSRGEITSKTVCVNKIGGSRDITISTPIGNGKGRFAGGPGNAHGTIKAMNMQRFILMGGRPRITSFNCWGERYTRHIHHRGLCGESKSMNLINQKPKHLTERALTLRPDLLCDFLLPGVFAVEGWIPLLQKGAEPHCLRTLLVPLPTIQTTITGEEIRERTHDWVDGSTLLFAFGFVLLCVSTERTRNLVSISVSTLMLHTRRK